MDVPTTTVWRRRLAWTLAITCVLAGAARGQTPTPGKSLRVVRDVDFKKLPEGLPKWETGLINNTWTGDLSTISIVPTDAEFGKALASERLDLGPPAGAVHDPPPPRLRVLARGRLGHGAVEAIQLHRNHG